ncbi:sugar ABC transporter ATP-binding protein [Dyadobacter jejuensis]|nr:sugar ABC transporter ATP-binding protein [Dyadobacter jejuensis]
MTEPIVRINQITKSFYGTKVLDQVDLELYPGEVLALMGENGAGKSTLMKILIGLLKADSGSISFLGKEVHSQKSGLEKTIAMIHQEMLVVPELTVAQNIFLGRERSFSGKFWLKDRVINQKAQGVLAQLGLRLLPTTKLKDLAVAEVQMVEIAKAISLEARVIIMDEPTSAISDKEVAALFAIIEALKRQGVAIIYISHKMDEIFRIADRIAVLRDGKMVHRGPAEALDTDRLVSLMVGRAIDQLFPEETTAIGAQLLAVKGLTRAPAFEDIHFELHGGEVLGLAGLMGAGRTELARVLCGLDSPHAGEIRIGGEVARLKNPQEAIAKGIGYVSEDRKAFGFIPRMSVKNNLTLSSLKQHRKGGTVNEKSEEKVMAENLLHLHIKASSGRQPVGELSGGNQQKVVLGRVLNTQPHIVILDEPTRGVDVGAKFEIYKLIHELKKSGKAILLISSELPEILGMSDRILVLAKGKQTALMSRAEASEERIMQHAVL